MQGKNNHHHLRIATRETLPALDVVGVCNQNNHRQRCLFGGCLINHITHCFYRSIRLFHVQQYILILFSLCMLLDLNHCSLLLLVPRLLHQSKFLVYEKWLGNKHEFLTLIKMTHFLESPLVACELHSGRKTFEKWLHPAREVVLHLTPVEKIKKHNFLYFIFRAD